MQPLDFLAAVLPSEGVYCLAEFDSPKKEHVFADSLTDLSTALDRFNTNRFNTYFALATFDKAGTRTAVNARYMRALFLDLDCDDVDPKKFKTQQEALDAFHNFLQQTNLDKICAPWIVSSGGGIHVYWSFDENISIEVWKPVAENLKKLCLENDLRIDFTVTADAARVLRVPGTTNWKMKDNPRPVKILQEGQPAHIPFATVAAAIKEKLTGKAAPEGGFLPGKKPTAKARATTTSNLLQSNSTTLFKNILVRTANNSGCGQLKYYLENASDDGMEPLWRGLLSLAKSCEDGEKAASKLSAMHPYPEARMRQKLREIKGPYPCTKFDTENPGVCTSCSHFGKITNPLALGNELQSDNAPKEIVIETTLSQITPQTVMRPSPPRGFSYGKNGGVYLEKKDEDAEGNSITKHVLVLPYDMFAVDILNQQGEHFVHMVAMRPEGSTEILLPQKAAVSKDDTVKTLASQNIIAAFGSGNDKNLFDYVRACVEDISASKKAIRIPSSMGWQDDGSFVHHNKIYAPDGTSRTIPMPGLENLVAVSRPRGTLEGWKRYPQWLIRREMYDVLALGLGVGFGSPLMPFTGLDALVFHAGSTKSGTGKSLAVGLSASVWGHPVRYRSKQSTSSVAMQQRAGLLGNLPLLSDEITAKNRTDFEWFPEFCFDLSEGQGKDRMESGANKERLNLSVWSLLAFMSSNTFALDYMTGARKHSSHGEVQRMLEWNPRESIDIAGDEVEIVKSLRDHFGVAGAQYAAWLAVNRDLAKVVYEEVYKRLKIDFNFKNEERFWHGGTACCVTSYILLGSKYSNIIDVPVAALTAALKRLVDKARAALRANVRTAEDVLNSYTREFFGRFVIVRAIEGAMVATLGEQGVIDQTITRSEIAGRVEHNVTPGHVNYFIEEQLLKSYCSSMSFGYSDFKEELERMYTIDYIKKDMLSKTKGPQMRVNTIKICRPESTLADKPKEDEED